MMIKTNDLIAMTLGLLMAFSGCQTEKEIPDKPEGSIPVGFSGDMPETRVATEYGSAADLTAIGVFAYFTNGMFSESGSIPNFMYNQQVEWQSVDGSWIYAPVKYWPDNTTDKISFFAYAPYVGETENSNLSFQDKGTASGFPVLGYTVSPVEADQMDFLAATPVMNRNDGNVSFKLHHTLTKVNVWVKNNDNTEGKSVTSFSITGIKSGTLIYYAPTADTDNGWKWAYPSSDVKETFTADITNFPVPNTILEGKKLLATFFLLPFGEGSQFSITYQYTAKDANDNTITQTINKENQPLPSTDSWSPGASVGYTIGIARKTVSVMQEDGSVSWEEDTGSETVKGTEGETGS